MGRVKRGMEMRRIIGWIFVFAALTAAGCGRRGTPREFSVDGFLATEHPDSARRLLQRIDPERLNRDDRARWALIMGLAEVSSGDTLAGKKFLDRGMRYYDRHGSDGERAAAWYTYAQAHVKTGNLEEGIRGYTQAAILAEKALAAGSSDDSLRRGTETLLVAVYHTLGLLYFEQGYDAVEPFAKAVEAARANGNTEQEGYSRFMLASAHCAAGDYRQAIETLAPLVEVADTIPFRYFAQQIRLQNLIFHTYLGDWTPEQLLEARKRDRSQGDSPCTAFIRLGRLGGYRAVVLRRGFGHHLPARRPARFGPLLYRRVAGLPGYVPSGECRTVQPGSGNLPRPGRRRPGL